MDHAAAVGGRIRDARAAWASESVVAVEALARGTRSHRQWLEELYRIGSGAAAGFRRAQVTREDLFRVLESSSVPIGQRVAAAVVLRKSGLDEEETARVKTVPERCAASGDRERLRIAVTSDDEARLVEALGDGDEDRDEVAVPRRRRMG